MEIQFSLLLPGWNKREKLYCTDMVGVILQIILHVEKITFFSVLLKFYLGKSLNLLTLIGDMGESFSPVHAFTFSTFATKHSLKTCLSAYLVALTDC